MYHIYQYEKYVVWQCRRKYIIIVRKDKLEESWQEFCQIQSAIVELDLESQDHTTYEAEPETLFSEAITVCIKHIAIKKINSRQNKNPL